MDHEHQAAGDAVSRLRSPDWPFLDHEGRAISFSLMAPPKTSNGPLVPVSTALEAECQNEVTGSSVRLNSQNLSSSAGSSTTVNEIHGRSGSRPED